MDTKIAPVTLGSFNLDPANMVVGLIVIAVIVAFLLGAKKETAMFAVFAGIIGVILAI